MRTFRLLIAGLGNVGTAFLRCLADREDVLVARHDVRFVVVGAAELGGVLIAPDGLGAGELSAMRDRHRSLAAIADFGYAGMTAQQLAREVRYDVLIDAMTTDLRTGQPGLDVVRSALASGRHAVLSDKGPLVVAFDELASLANLPGLAHREGLPLLRFDACVGGALPTLAVALRDLVGMRIERIECALNGTCQSILGQITQGASFAEALTDAQSRGIVEADHRLDVSGLDLAGKLAIIANVVLHQRVLLRDIRTVGIDTLDPAAVRAGDRSGDRMLLLGIAQRCPQGYALSVSPQRVASDHPLAALSPDDMGVVFYTDVIPRLAVTSHEPTAEPTAGALLRNVLQIVQETAGPTTARGLSGPGLRCR